jgi:hypothetical protein
MTEIEAVGHTPLEDRFFAATDKACELQKLAKTADRHAPVHAELRRMMEQLADIERELRVVNGLRAAPHLPAAQGGSGGPKTVSRRAGSGLEGR